MKTGQALKLVAIGTATIVGGLVVFRAYRLTQAAGQGIANLPGQMGDALKDVGTLVKEQAAIAADSMAVAMNGMSNSVSGAVNDAKSALGLSSGDTSPAKSGSAYITVVNFTNWPASVKAAIDLIKKKRGQVTSTNSNDYLGWRVYSDGTFTSPSNEYFQDSFMRAVYDGASLEGKNSSGISFNEYGVVSDNGFTPVGDAYDVFSYTPPSMSSGRWPSVNDIPY